MLITKDFFAYFLIGAMFGVVFGVYATGIVNVVPLDLCERAVDAARGYSVE